MTTAETLKRFPDARKTGDGRARCEAPAVDPSDEPPPDGDETAALEAINEGAEFEAAGDDPPETHADREWRHFIAVARPWPDGRGRYDPYELERFRRLTRRPAARPGGRPITSV